MPEAVLVSALRTPIGTAFELAHHVVTAAAAGLDRDLVDDVILGEGRYQLIIACGVNSASTAPR